MSPALRLPCFVVRHDESGCLTDVVVLVLVQLLDLASEVVAMVQEEQVKAVQAAADDKGTSPLSAAATTASSEKRGLTKKLVCAE